MFKTSAKSVDSIMATFNKTIGELRKSAEDHRNISDAKQCDAVRAQAAATSASQEATRAEAMAERLEALVK